MSDGNKELTSAVKKLARGLASHLRDRIMLGVKIGLSRHTLTAVSKLKGFAQENLTDMLRTRGDLTAQVFPDGTRFAKCGKGVQVVVEQKPSVRTLSLDRRLLTTLTAETRGGGVKGLFPVSLPYVVFVCSMHPFNEHYQHESLRVFFRRNPLRSVKDVLGHTILPNMQGVVCMGGRWPVVRGTIIEVCEKAIAHYWGAGFTLDYTENWVKMSRQCPQLADLSTWVEASKIDPGFILGVDWQPYISLETLLSHMAGEPEIESPDAEFIHELTGDFEREISKLIDQAVRLDDAALGVLTEAIVRSPDAHEPSKSDPDGEI